MKSNHKNTRKRTTLLLSLMLVCAMAVCGGLALGTIPTLGVANAEPATIATGDPSPAIYVADKNINSVVGIIASTEGWSRSSGEVEEVVAQGSGVVIAEGGYVLTNNHVIAEGSSYQVLMPNGNKVKATLVGADSSLDLAVLKVEEQADMLVAVTIGSSSDLKIGSTAVAIGNPGGEILANSVTQGIVSALERSSVNSNNTTRDVDYIQHDAAISSGNSGGGLFDYQGSLIGINTLKYSGSAYSGLTFEGLGFAIPVETAYPIALQLIENGKVIRPQMGVTVADYDGPSEPLASYAPASVCIYSVNEGSPAEDAGLKQFDFIYAVNGERITSLRELTTALDQFEAGNTVTITVVRYENVGYVANNNNSYFGNFYGYGGYGDYGNDDSSDTSTYGNGTIAVGGGYTTIDVDVKLEILE